MTFQPITNRYYKVKWTLSLYCYGELRSAKIQHDPTKLLLCNKRHFPYIILCEDLSTLINQSMYERGQGGRECYYRCNVDVKPWAICNRTYTCVHNALHTYIHTHTHTRVHQYSVRRNNFRYNKTLTSSTSEKCTKQLQEQSSPLALLFLLSHLTRQFTKRTNFYADVMLKVITLQR